MNNKVFTVGSVNVYEDDIKDLSRLAKKVREIPCSSKALLDFRDRIIKMAKDIAIVSAPSRDVLYREIGALTSGIIYSFISNELDAIENKKGDTDEQ
jgi:hypothetical protein